jgi:hypothetical protein
MTADTTNFAMRCAVLLEVLHAPCWTVHSIHNTLDVQFKVLGQVCLQRGVQMARV